MGSGKLKRSEENRGRLQAKARPEGNWERETEWEREDPEGHAQDS